MSWSPSSRWCFCPLWLHYWSPPPLQAEHHIRKRKKPAACVLLHFRILCVIRHSSFSFFSPLQLHKTLLVLSSHIWAELACSMFFCGPPLFYLTRGIVYCSKVRNGRTLYLTNGQLVYGQHNNICALRLGACTLEPFSGQIYWGWGNSELDWAALR